MHAHVKYVIYIQRMCNPYSSEDEYYFTAKVGVSLFILSDNNGLRQKM